MNREHTTTARRWIIALLCCASFVAVSGCAQSSTAEKDPIADPGLQINAQVQPSWGPPRTTYSHIPNTPPSGPLIDSITNDPNWNDEPYFFYIGESPSGAAINSQDLSLPEGKSSYEGVIEFDNEGSEALKDASARLNLPQSIDGRTSISSYISSSNSVEISSSVIMSPDSSYGVTNLSIKPGSVVFHSEGEVDGTNITASRLTSSKGIPLGCQSLNGLLPPGTSCRGWISFEIVAQSTESVLTLFGHPSGSNSWLNSVTLNSDGDLYLLLRFDNLGATEEKNVQLSVQLPPNFVYVPRSVEETTGKKKNLESAGDGIVSNGLNIGDYQPGSVSQLKLELRYNGPVTCQAQQFHIGGQLNVDGQQESPLFSVNVVKNHGCG